MRRTFLTAFIAIILFIPLSACTGGDNITPPAIVSGEDTGMAYKTISPAEAKELIGNDGVILVDVRTKEEYDEGHIPGAALLPLDDIAQKAEEILPDKDAVIIIYCRSGRRSAITSEQLLDMGYKTVYDLGGIIDWPYETVQD